MVEVFYACVEKKGIEVECNAKTHADRCFDLGPPALFTVVGGKVIIRHGLLLPDENLYQLAKKVRIHKLLPDEYKPPLE